MPFSSVEEILEEIEAGRMVVVVDDEDRENEGDLVMAAEEATPWDINFMATHGRGLICVSLTPVRFAELEIPMMVAKNTALHGTAFGVSVDLIGPGRTGISAFDRAATIRALCDRLTEPSDLARPGHVFPLRSVEGGVLRRAGHTEAATDLARLAGMSPAGVLCEILNTDGTMARLPQLEKFARVHGLRLISIADLISYRRHRENLVRVVTASGHHAEERASAPHPESRRKTKRADQRRGSRTTLANPPAAGEEDLDPVDASPQTTLR